MKYVLVGYGRMGREIERQAAARGHERTGVFDSKSSDELRRSGRGALRGAEVAFEFSTPSAAEENLLALLGCEVAVVCGTTGWTPGPGLREALDGAAAGVVVAANFSIGMNLFCRVVTQAGRLYGAIGGHDPFVLEAHQRGKRDTPSGTARQLARLLVEADPRLDSIHEGNPSCPLPANVLQVASLRAGSEFGSHTVGFDGEHDRVVLRHDARGRAGFALGAVLTAEWLSGRSGAHDFDEVVDSLMGQGGIR